MEDLHRRFAAQAEVSCDDAVHNLDEQRLLGNAVSQAVNEVRDKIVRLQAVIILSLRKPKRPPRSQSKRNPLSPSLAYRCRSIPCNRPDESTNTSG